MKFYFFKSIILSFFLLSYYAHAQCTFSDITHTICNIQSLPGPHGDLHLNDIYFNETGETVPTGSFWRTKPELKFVLEDNSDIVRVWDIREFSEARNEDKVAFELINPSCSTELIAEVKLLLAPFPGVALPPFGDFDINLEVCNSGEFDLFTSLAKDDSTPSPHLNGKWYELDGPGGTELASSIENMQTVDVTYVPRSKGGPLIDQVQKYYRYKVVSDLGGCLQEQSVDIAVSVVRQVSAGNPKIYGICENEFTDATSIFNGGEINLRDDLFLSGEDEEGIWVPDSDGQISNAGDSIVNLLEVYNKKVTDNINTHRFNPIALEYKYTVPQRSGVCTDSTSVIRFTIIEALRPFKQDTSINNIFCEEGGINGVDLFSLLEFTKETRTSGKVDDFIYPNNSKFTKWEYVEGPQNDIGENEEITDLEETGIFSFLTPDENDAPTNFIQPGTYKFNYIVDSWINAENIFDICELLGSTEGICDRACKEEVTEVIIEVIALNYAGENTVTTLCSNVGDVNLTDMLVSESPTRAVVRTGQWSDKDGNLIPEDFTVPNIPQVDGDREYEFTYATTTAEGCIDSSVLTLKVTKAPYAGATITHAVCRDNLSVVLYDLVNNDSGNIADPTGIWEGPNGYRSVDHTGTFEDGNIALPVLQPGVYTYTVLGRDACAGEVVTSQVTINFVEPLKVTGDFTQEVCKLEGRDTFNLFDFLDVTADRTGTFTAIGTNHSQDLIDANGNYFIKDLTRDFYEFEYNVKAIDPCSDVTQTMRLEVFDENSLPVPGTNGEIVVCSNKRNVTLFDALGGPVQDDGIWTGPFEYMSDDNLGEFKEGDVSLPVLQPGIYTYTVKGKGPCGVVERTSEVKVTFVDPIFVGDDFEEDFCIKDLSTNLYELLDRTTVRTGTFRSINSEDVNLTDQGLFTFEKAGTFKFEYTVVGIVPCDSSTLTVTINIKEVEKPSAPISTYCILDAVRLSDVEIPINEFWYVNAFDEDPYTEDPVLRDGMIFYLEKQEFGCKSDRLEVKFEILNVGEKDDAGVVKHCTIDFQDAVTPNNDDINDTFRMDTTDDATLLDRISDRMDENSISKGKFFNLGVSFPDYELQIFNRYGALVFEGNRTRDEFNGRGNKTGQLSGELPTGVYFFIFNPNFENHQPIQGSFYLSK